jgi:hypothetical protein
LSLTHRTKPGKSPVSLASPRFLNWIRDLLKTKLELWQIDETLFHWVLLLEGMAPAFLSLSKNVTTLLYRPRTELSDCLVCCISSPCKLDIVFCFFSKYLRWLAVSGIRRNICCYNCTSLYEELSASLSVQSWSSLLPV